MEIQAELLKALENYYGPNTHIKLTSCYNGKFKLQILYYHDDNSLEYVCSAIHENLSEAYIKLARNWAELTKELDHENMDH